jgi:hypothetical protein
MFKTSLLLVVIACTSPRSTFAQQSGASGTSFYLGLGGGLDAVQSARFISVVFKTFQPSGWGVDAGFGRTLVMARNKPSNYAVGLRGSVTDSMAGDVSDDVNLWHLAVARRWQPWKTTRMHTWIAGGLSLTDYFESQFMYTGIQSGTGLFSSGSSANYAIQIDRKLLPGFYGRAAIDCSLGNRFSVEAGVWTSIASKLQVAGVELLLNVGRMRKARTSDSGNLRSTP